MSTRTFEDSELLTAALRLRSQGFVICCIEPFFMPPTTAAAVLLIAERTLRAWRAEGKGPPFYTLGSGVRYRLDEVLQSRIDGHG